LYILSGPLGPGWAEIVKFLFSFLKRRKKKELWYRDTWMDRDS
jgi:hypothetical protein